MRVLKTRNVRCGLVDNSRVLSPTVQLKMRCHLELSKPVWGVVE